MKHAALLAAAALGYAWVLLTATATGCAHSAGPAPSTAPAPDPAPAYPPCPPGGPLPTSQSICEGRQTPDARLCAECPAWGGCLDTVDLVYCARLSNCDADPLCPAPSGPPQLRPGAH